MAKKTLHEGDAAKAIVVSTDAPARTGHGSRPSTSAAGSGLVTTNSRRDAAGLPTEPVLGTRLYEGRAALGRRRRGFRCGTRSRLSLGGASRSSRLAVVAKGPTASAT